MHRPSRLRATETRWSVDQGEHGRVTVFRAGRDSAGQTPHLTSRTSNPAPTGTTPAPPSIAMIFVT